MADSDELDALLDEAMDIVDEQERKHSEDVKQQEAKLDADLQKALDEQSGVDAGDAMGGDMIKMLQSLLGGGGGPGSQDDNASFETFKRDVGQLVSTLEGMADLKDEDRANLTRVQELLSVLENDDEDKARELLDTMSADPTSHVPGASSEEVEQSYKSCLAALQQLSDASVSNGSAATATATSPGAGEMASAADATPDNVAAMLLNAILDPDFVEPIKAMRDAYEPYLEAKKGDMSEADTARYRQQHAKTVEICAFLQVPIHKEDDERVTRLLELMHEFSELGEPPKDLPEYAPKRDAPAEAPA